MAMTGDRTYSTVEAAKLAGISFRQADYAVRNGNVTIESDVTGSGRQRSWTPEEVDRLRELFVRVRQAREVLEAYATGELWAQLAHEKARHG